MTHGDKINLRTTDSLSENYPVLAGATAAAVSFVVTTWSTAVVSAYWSATLGEHEDWIAYSPAQTFSSSTTGVPRLYLPAAGAIRFQVTTAAATADDDAKVIVEMS